MLASDVEPTIQDYILVLRVEKKTSPGHEFIQDDHLPPSNLTPLFDNFLEFILL